MEEKKGNFKSDSVYSKKLRAGKRRTYFFDVKSTKASDYFLTITESKKRQDDSYERFKIFLYKEDFNKFLESLTETIDHVKTELMPHYDFDEFAKRQAEYERNRENNRIEGEAEPENRETSFAPDTEMKRIDEPVKDSTPPAPVPPPPPTEHVDDEDLKW
ncbi:MAG TPA: DUF3276 family protein [Chitinophagales bacterium]|nr:DUF3276 family protein [Chitinophagales bacterium]